jgi:hypothetical protein
MGDREAVGSLPIAAGLTIKKRIDLIVERDQHAQICPKCRAVEGAEEDNLQDTG